MDPDRLSIEIRKFLKAVGVTSQREIEAAVQKGLDSGKLKESEKLFAKMVLTIPAIGVSHEVDSTIELD